MNGVERIAAERKRQIEVEGWTPEHDDQHKEGQLALASIGYAYFAAQTKGDRNYDRRYATPEEWPWSLNWWKPSEGNTVPDRIRELEKAGALIAAEIDRLIRLEK
jgi:hypothetical protein